MGLGVSFRQVFVGVLAFMFGYLGFWLGRHGGMFGGRKRALS